jgi:hypothetical protein
VVAATRPSPIHTTTPSVPPRVLFVVLRTAVAYVGASSTDTCRSPKRRVRSAFTSGRLAGAIADFVPTSNTPRPSRTRTIRRAPSVLSSRCARVRASSMSSSWTAAASCSSDAMRASAWLARARASAYMLIATVCSAASRALALPSSLSEMSRNRTTATATIGTMTIRTKKRVSRRRKLIRSGYIVLHAAPGVACTGPCGVLT